MISNVAITLPFDNSTVTLFVSSRSRYRCVLSCNVYQSVTGIDNVYRDTFSFAMASNKNPFEAEVFKREYAKQRNAQLEHDLVLAQTKLRYLMEHVGSDIVPLPPEASFLSEREKHDIKQEVKNMYNNSIDKMVADEQKKTPRSPPGQIRLEITNGMVYYMFHYVINLQSEIDPSLL